VQWPKRLCKFLAALLRPLNKDVFTRPYSFYNKNLNEAVASNVAPSDLRDTDLLKILDQVSVRARALAGSLVCRELRVQDLNRKVEQRIVALDQWDATLVESGLGSEEPYRSFCGAIIFCLQ